MPAEITIQYVRPVAGHPKVHTRVTVEHTDLVQALLDEGLAVKVDEDQDDTANDQHEGDDDSARAEGDDPDEQTAPDGSTKLPAKAPARKQTHRRGHADVDG